MQKFVVRGRPQVALTEQGLGLCAQHYRKYWHLPRKANERWIMTMNNLELTFEVGGDLAVDSVALSFQMARISVLRYGHSPAELELFYVTALLLIDVLGETSGLMSQHERAPCQLAICEWSSPKVKHLQDEVYSSASRDHRLLTSPCPCPK